MKSIDLDIWTPEQMESVQKWGNRRCNLYWEAHLKAGHVPADHKIESFIRSKYESRRWAKDGPPPADPSVLDGGESAPAAPAAAVAAVGTSTVEVPKKAAPKVNLFDDDEPAPTPAPAPAPAAAAKVQAPPAEAPKPAGGGIFDLDWHDPSPTTTTTTTSPTTGAKGKNDIMSLFATSSKPAAPSGGGGFGDFSTPAPASSVSGLQSSFGGLDLSSSSAAVAKSTSTPAYGGAASNPWSTGTSTTSAAGGAGGLFDTHDVWGSGGTSTTTSATTAKPKDDAFADIWGDFK